MGRWGYGSRALLSVVVALVVSATACSNSSNPATDTSAAPPTSSPTGGTSTQTLEQGPGGQLVFDPATFSVKTGDTITVSNVGTLAHTFTVTGQSIDVTNAGGASQDVTIDLPPGTYPFICKFHQSSGMKGTLTVTS